MEDISEVPFHNYTFDELNETILFEITSNTLINANLSLEIVYENGTQSVIEPISFDSNKTQFKMQINSELAGRQKKHESFQWDLWYYLCQTSTIDACPSKNVL